MATVIQKIKDIEDEMAKTQKNKATAHHLGLLKAKLAKLRRELLTPSTKGGGGAGEGFDVTKSGDARVGLVGFPSVGKSTLLNKLTGTFSEVASYEFTTLTCIPGVIMYRGAKIQLLDLPGIIEGAKDGKGRGRQVISTARTCNCILIVLDAIKPITHKRLIEKELEGFGIRLNKEPPNLTFRKKDKGGINFTSTVANTHLDLETVKAICSEYRIHNADITLRHDATADDLIDVIEGSRVYIPCIYAVNKIDQITLEELEILDKLPHYCPVSAHLEWNLDGLLEKIWEYLNLTRIYTKPKGMNPDYEDPVILSSKKRTVEDFCNRIHKDMLKQFKYALVWGSSVKHKPQRVGKEHQLEDEDVVQIIKKVSGSSHPYKFGSESSVASLCIIPLQLHLFRVMENMIPLLERLGVVSVCGILSYMIIKHIRSFMKVEKEPIRVLVTGAAGQIGYALVPMIARGTMLGPDQPVILHLFDIEPTAEALNVVKMELIDSAFPLLKGIVATTDVVEACKGINIAIMVGGHRRKEGMERKDILSKNVPIYEAQASALEQHAAQHCKVLVIANPANTNALIVKESAPSIPEKNITCLTRLDHNRALGQIAERLNVHVSEVKNVVVWGNHSSTLYPDVNHARITTGNREMPVRQLVADDHWLNSEFITTVQERGAAIIKARERSSAFSAASAACDHVHDWILGTSKGTWVSMGVCSDGSYGIEPGLIYSFPVTCRKGQWSIVQGNFLPPRKSLQFLFVFGKPVQ
ncbi:hypothetical protein Dimus_024775, partial [Dionaea muscipula]